MEKTVSLTQIQCQLRKTETEGEINLENWDKMRKIKRERERRGIK